MQQTILTLAVLEKFCLHFQEYALGFKSDVLQSNTLVVDIGSNDGLV